MSNLKTESERLQYPVTIVRGVDPKILKICSLRDVLNMMAKDEQIKKQTNLVRSLTGKLQSEAKDNSLAFVLGEFHTKRKDSNLKTYAPVMAFDIDKIPHQNEYQSIFEALQEIEFTFFISPSIRGKGIRFFVVHDTEAGNHRECYVQIANYYANHLGIPTSADTKDSCFIDLSCKNESRLWYMPHIEEEDYHYNADSNIFHFIKKQSSQAPKGESGSNPTALKYTDKIRILQLMALDKTPYEPGSRHWHLFYFCALMAEYGITQSDALKEIESDVYHKGDCDHSKVRAIAVRTYKRNNNKNPGSKYKKSYTDAELFSFVAKIDFKNKEYKKEIDSILKQHPEILEESEGTEPTKYEIALSFIQANHNLERNEITRFVEDSGQRMTEHDYNSIYIDLKYNRHKISKNDAFALINSNRILSYNPFVRFIQERGHYSSNGNIKKLAQSIHTTTGQNAGREDFVELFVSKWFVGMIASAFKQNVNPLLLVLCGGQNTGKTEWFRRLLPDELKDYMAESKLDEGKDSEILMTDKLLILDDEYGGKSKRDAKRLKELISKDYFTVRPAYARTSERLRRIATLGGTSNEYNVLSDITGNRRVIPIKVIDIDKELYNSIDKTALFMEGFRTYLSWEAKKLWQLSKPEIIFLNRSTEDFEQVSAEKEMFYKYFRLPKTDEESITIFLTTTEVIEYIQSKNNLRLSLNKMGTELRSIYGERENGKGEDRGIKGYYLVKKSNMKSGTTDF